MSDTVDSENRYSPEIAYYKSQVNELSKSIIDLQYLLAQFTHESQQTRNGLKLIAGLRDMYSFSHDFENVFDYFTESILTQMGMDRSLVLLSTGNEAYYTPVHIKGYSESELIYLSQKTINLKKEYLVNNASLLVNGLSSDSELIIDLREIFSIQFFILVPVIFKNNVIAYLLTGRNKEMTGQSSSRLQPHDLHILEAIAGIISTLKKQFEEINVIETERTRIAKELHDDIGSELTTIRILSQSLKQQFNQEEESGKKINRIAEAGKNVLDSVSEIIWSMNHRNDNLESLCSYIRRFASDLLEIKEINYEFQFPEVFPEAYLNDEIRRNIFLTVKEALNNIVKHSGANNVNILISTDKSTFRIQIQDDGVGLDKGNPLGNGLLNMNQRINSIGGKFEIVSAGIGTLIRFETKLDRK